MYCSVHFSTLLLGVHLLGGDCGLLLSSLNIKFTLYFPFFLTKRWYILTSKNSLFSPTIHCIFKFLIILHGWSCVKYFNWTESVKQTDSWLTRSGWHQKRAMYSTIISNWEVQNPLYVLWRLKGMRWVQKCILNSKGNLIAFFLI